MEGCEEATAMMAQQTDVDGSTELETGTAWEDPLSGDTYRLARFNGLEVVLEAEFGDGVRVVDARNFPGRYVEE